LYEEALDLWEEAVKNAPTEVKNEEPMTGPTYNIMGLFPRVVACLQFGSDTLKKVLKIIEYYIILDPVGIMQVIAVMDYINAQRYANQLFAGFAGLGELKSEPNRMMMNIVELVIQGCPLNVFFSTFVESGLFYKIIAAVVIENVSPTKFSSNELGKLDYQFPIHEHPCENRASKSRLVTSLRSFHGFQS
jgi:hypothetical protein